MRRLSRYIKSLQSDAGKQDGYILITALGVMVLVTLLAITSYTVATSSINDATSTAKRNRAYQLAASALDYEVSRFERGYTLATQANKTLTVGSKTITYDVAYNPEAGSRFSLTVTAGTGTERETVSTGYSYFDPTDAVYTGAGNIFGGAAFNSRDSMIIGPMFMTVDRDAVINSNPLFVDGPLYVANGQLSPRNTSFWVYDNLGAVSATPYVLYLDKRITPEPDRTRTVVPSMKVTPPFITAEIDAVFRDKAVSLNQYYTTDKNIGGPTGIFPVGADGVLRVPNDTVIYVSGTATVDSAVRSYQGRFAIFGTNQIQVNGRLVPEYYDGNENSTDPTVTESRYYTLISGASGAGNKANQIPRSRTGYCVGLASHGTVNFSWNSGKNDTSVFAFCGAAYSGGIMSFNESLRGSIIARSAIEPTKKTILATQRDLREYLPEEMKLLLARVLVRDEWVRQ